MPASLLHVLPDAKAKGYVRAKTAKEIVSLNLYFAPVTDVGLKELTHLKNLQFLGLSGTKVTDKGLELLATLVNLQNLDVSKTKVTSAGVQELQKALPKCKIKTLSGD
jgi:Leucine-rich repeat (LRR) protein